MSDPRDIASREKRDELIVRLNTERIVLGLTQKQVADAGGMARNTVIDLERGKRNSSLESFRKYALGMGYRLDIVPIEEDES